MKTVRLIHWNEREVIEKANFLVDVGYEVISGLPAGPGFFKDLEARYPDAIVIDLSRLPSQGRDLALAIRKRKGTRHIPIIFVDGDPTKAEKIMNLLPDAAYTDWDNIVAAIDRAIEIGALDVIVPDSTFAAYTGKSLLDKLGIKAQGRVVHIGSPEELISVLGKLPPGSVLISEPDSTADLSIWFVSSEPQLSAQLKSTVTASKNAPVWIAWPKVGSAYKSDLTQQRVREIAMGAGLVDYKICSIDRNWSALLFTWRGTN